MKIGIIGVGRVGGTLGKAWASTGHDIMFGVRTRDNPKGLALLDAIGARAKMSTVGEAAAFGDVVVLAVPWSAAQNAVRRAGDLEGKVVVDVTNAFAPGFSGLSLEPGTSTAEEIAKWAGGAHVVKAFNSTGSGNMADPDYGGERASMLYCGDDAGAKATVARLGQELGFDMVDVGALSRARALDWLALLWVTLAFDQGTGPNVAFKLLRR
jgi:predicted dinucleotide-binding enzyme